MPEVGRLPGIDGKAKMSKSLGNTINLGASADEIRAAVKMVYTDPLHLNVSDPGHLEGNVAFLYLDAFDTDKEGLAEMKAHYQRGGLGDSVVKKRLEGILQDLLAPDPCAPRGICQGQGPGHADPEGRHDEGARSGGPDDRRSAQGPRLVLLLKNLSSRRVGTTCPRVTFAACWRYAWAQGCPPYRIG